MTRASNLERLKECVLCKHLENCHADEKDEDEDGRCKLYEHIAKRGDEK